LRCVGSNQILLVEVSLNKQLLLLQSLVFRVQVLNTLDSYSDILKFSLSGTAVFDFLSNLILKIWEVTIINRLVLSQEWEMVVNEIDLVVSEYFLQERILTWVKFIEFQVVR